MIINGMVSTFSYVVNLFPHSSQTLLRLMELFSSAGLESMTLIFSWPQKGHLMLYLSFLFYSSNISVSSGNQVY